MHQTPTTMWKPALVVLFLSTRALAADIPAHKAGIWSIPPAKGLTRWVIIHDLEASASSGIYHIEVIGRKKGAPAWKIIRLVRHMAITEQALAANLKAPLTKGGVYPESFNDAYGEWRKENGGSGGFVCSTSLLACMDARN